MSNAQTVLLVDDDPSVQKLLSVVLENAGYSADVASNGWEAMYRLHAVDYDILILDIVMPEMEGLETLRRVRAKHAGVKTLAISGFGEGLYLRTAKLLGADATLAKPFKPSELLETLQLLASKPGAAGSSPAAPAKTKEGLYFQC